MESRKRLSGGAYGGAEPGAAIMVLAGLLRDAGLPDAVAVRQLTGRGFDNEIHAAELADGRRVVLRRRRRPHRPEHHRALFLESHGVPVPRLLAATADASLYDFASGELLGDLIEAGRASAEVWRLVGVAFRRVHEVAFPPGLAGKLHPDRIVLRPVDPVAEVHAGIDRAVPGLRRRARGALVHLPALHEVVDRAAGPLRSAATSLIHGDDNMWNIIIDENRAWVIDWGGHIDDPAKEVALLDKHASLFNGRGLDPAFFVGYGRPPTEPNTSLHRVVETMRWAASSDWAWIARQDLPDDLKLRARGWLRTLLAHVARLPEHLERLRALT